MARRRPTESKYPRLTTRLPPHLHARLQAASAVLGRPVDELIETALESHFAALDETQTELIDRFAAEVLVRSDSDPGDR